MTELEVRIRHGPAGSNTSTGATQASFADPIASPEALLKRGSLPERKSHLAHRVKPKCVNAVDEQNVCQKQCLQVRKVSVIPVAVQMKQKKDPRYVH